MTPAELRERVRREGLLGREGPVVAMVSGGRDSVCLLDVAVAVRDAESVKGLHVNYGLRGADSDADERLCVELGARLGVELEVVRAEPGKRERGNLQAWARELRYGAARRLADELEGRSAGRPATVRSRALVATGHTASDQLETILYRLAASPGRRALLGMAPREGRIVRPLLGVTREQTAAYCRARGLSWREDESNDDERYARARVRRGLVPALRAVHPAAQESVLRTSEQLREESELLGELVERELAGRDSIAVERLAELHPALARLVVVRLAEDVAGDYVPQAGRRVGEILALAADRRSAGGGRAEVHVGGSVGAVIEGGELRMVKLPARPPADGSRGDGRGGGRGEGRAD
ncbi:MAG TPA: tRNA lysidine(34) synthetase TilS [Solirubrobacteraceae bacterium]|nr:tRNA lysidine(34) synthetase TilS [Solirubrobacteraceae bacterium]